MVEKGHVASVPVATVAARVFAALGDPIRCALVARLAAGDATVGQLAEPYSVTLQAISKHLMVLQEAGVVTKRKVGQQRVVHLEIEHLDLAVVWLENYRRQAEAQYQRLDAVLADLNRTNKPFHERTLR